MCCNYFLKSKSSTSQPLTTRVCWRDRACHVHWPGQPSEPATHLPRVDCSDVSLTTRPGWRWTRHEKYSYTIATKMTDVTLALCRFVRYFCATLLSGNPGCISEGSRTTLFGSSTSVLLFSPITARRTTAELSEGSAANAQDAGKPRSLPFFSYFLYIVCFHPIYYVCPTVLQLRPPFCISDPFVLLVRSHNGRSSPLPTAVHASLHFYCRKSWAFSSLIDSRRILRTHTS